ncbi:hypothetical protein ACQPYV_33155 [Micromonospora saelicesensis]
MSLIWPTSSASNPGDPAGAAAAPCVERRRLPLTVVPLAAPGLGEPSE